MMVLFNLKVLKNLFCSKFQQIKVGVKTRHGRMKLNNINLTNNIPKYTSNI